MGEILAKLFIDPSTLPGGVNCVDYMLPCDPLKVPRQTPCWFKPNASAAGRVVLVLRVLRVPLRGRWMTSGDDVGVKHEYLSRVTTCGETRVCLYPGS